MDYTVYYEQNSVNVPHNYMYIVVISTYYIYIMYLSHQVPMSANVPFPTRYQ